MFLKLYNKHDGPVGHWQGPHSMSESRPKPGWNIVLRLQTFNFNFITKLVPS